MPGFTIWGGNPIKTFLPHSEPGDPNHRSWGDIYEQEEQVISCDPVLKIELLSQNFQKQHPHTSGATKHAIARVQLYNGCVHF